MYRTEPDMGAGPPRIRVPGEAGFGLSIRNHARDCERCRYESYRIKSCPRYQALMRDMARAAGNSNEAIDPDRIATRPEGVPVTMAELIKVPR